MLSDLTSGVGRQRVLAVVSVLVLIMASFATMGVADHSQDRDELDQHCPNHQTEPKDDDPAPGDVNELEVDDETVWLHYSEDLHSVEFYADEDGTEPITVEFCIKAGDKAGGVEVGQEGHVSWENNGGQTPQISYVVVYEIIDDEDDCPAELELTPGEATNELGDTHQVTATVTDDDGACAGVEVLFEVTGAHQTTGTATTNDDGHAHFEYTGEETGTDTITACTTDEGDAPAACDTTEHVHDTATKHWVDGADGCPAHLTLSPDDATNTVGDTHQVTATVTDDGGGACAGIEVLFEVTGAHEATGTATTNDDGHAHFEYTGEEAGTDTITACTTDEGKAPAACDDTEATVQGTATKHWVEPPEEAMWTCSARALEVLGLDPFNANVAEDGSITGVECVTEDGSLVNLVLSDDAAPGALVIRVLYAETEATDDGPLANAALAEVIIRDGDGETLIGVFALSSEASGSCEDGSPELDSSSRTLGINILGEGGEFSDQTEVPLGPLGTLWLNHTDEGEDHQTQRALWLTGEGDEEFLLGDIIVGESTADHEGNPCG